MPPAAGALRLGFRGEDATLRQDGKGLPFIVKVAEPMGSHVLLTGTVWDSKVRIVAPPCWVRGSRSGAQLAGSTHGARRCG